MPTIACCTLGHRLQWRARLAILLCLLAFWSAARAEEDPHVLVLGRISDDPHAHYQQLKPLLDYVVPRMADVGIREGRILMARDLRQMESYLRRGRVDWVTETTGSAVQLQARAGALPLLITERNGVSRYRSLFFARRDSGIRTLDDLRGRSVAFQNLTSTTAYYLPATELLARRLPMEILLSPRDRPAPGSVGYVFARSELNISTWVHKGLADAGAISDLDWNDPKRVPPPYRRDLVIIHRSEPVPRAMEMVRGGLRPAVRERLRQVLMQAERDPDAREAMLRFFNTTRFLPVDEDTARALARVRDGVAQVTAQLE